jgi:hypothetical protein
VARSISGAGQAVEFDRKVHREGHVLIAGERIQGRFAPATDGEAKAPAGRQVG